MSTRLARCARRKRYTFFFGLLFLLLGLALLQLFVPLFLLFFSLLHGRCKAQAQRIPPRGTSPATCASCIVVVVRTCRLASAMSCFSFLRRSFSCSSSAERQNKTKQKPIIRIRCQRRLHA